MKNQIVTALFANKDRSKFHTYTFRKSEDAEWIWEDLEKRYGIKDGIEYRNGGKEKFTMIDWTIWDEK